MDENLVDCPVCKGTGKMQIKMITLGSKAPAEVSNINCIHCDGRGKVSKEEAREIQDLIDYDKKMWCKCGNPSKRSNYHPDGKGKWVTKHHYTCADCGKVTQIG